MVELLLFCNILTPTDYASRVFTKTAVMQIMAWKQPIALLVITSTAVEQRHDAAAVV
jgi:hypothetical protein